MENQAGKRMEMEIEALFSASLSGLRGLQTSDRRWTGFIGRPDVRHMVPGQPRRWN